mgnify:FL=1
MSPSEPPTDLLPRRGFLAALGGTLAGGAYLVTDDRSASRTHVFCPSEEEMETMSWIRGHFERDRQSVTAGESFEGTLMLKNSGGEAGAYEATLWFAKWDREDDRLVKERPATSISASVPAQSATEAEVTAEAPESGGEWLLEAPRLRSTCDLIQPATQQLEVDDAE